MSSDHEQFNGELSELSANGYPEPRDLEAELFNKKSYKEVIADVEEQLGLIPKKGTKRANVRRQVALLSPAKDDDKELMTSLLNDDKKYRIVMWRDTWTVHGDFRVFVVFEELIDDKKDKQ